MIPLSQSQAYWSALQGANTYSISDAALAQVQATADPMHVQTIMADVTALADYNQQVHKLRKEVAPWLLGDKTVETPDVYAVNTPSDLIYLQGSMMDWTMSHPILKQQYLDEDISVPQYQHTNEDVGAEDYRYRRVHDGIYESTGDHGRVVSYFEDIRKPEDVLSLEFKQTILQAQEYVLKRLAIDEDALCPELIDH